jgi:hypothetical protein
MSLNVYRDEADRFLRAIHAADGSLEEKIGMLQQELDILRQAQPEDAAVIRHHTYDLLFLVFEIAAQFGADLDAEWAAGRARKAEKYHA